LARQDQARPLLAGHDRTVHPGTVVRLLGLVKRRYR
jgi:hypothetical protein